MSFAVAALNAAGSGMASTSVSLDAPAASKASTLTVHRSGKGSVTVTVHVLDANRIGLSGVYVTIGARGVKSRSWSSTSDASGFVARRVTGLEGVETFSATAGGVDLASVTLAFGATSTTTTTKAPAGPTTLQGHELDGDDHRSDHQHQHLERRPRSRASRYTSLSARRQDCDSRATAWR